MPLPPRLASLWRNLFDKARKERELAEELDAYLEMLVEQKIEKGHTPEEARRAALLEIGGREQVKEKVREVSMGHQLETFWRDIRYALRMLRRNPGFATVAALSLALGIGANTTMFSLINALLLRSLPVKDPQQLALFSINGLRGGQYSFNYPLVTEFRAQSRAFTGIIAAAGTGAPMQFREAGAEPQSESVRPEQVSGNYFSVLGVNAAAGRLLTEADDSLADPQPVAVISHEYWRLRFGADPG